MSRERETAGGDKKPGAGRKLRYERYWNEHDC